MVLKPISLIGRDDAASPFLSDFRQFSTRIVQLFHDQPLIARRLAPMIEPLQFDGMTEHETALLKDIDRPEYAMDPKDSHANIEGDSVIVKTPQIFQSASLLNDRWKAVFAGKARMPILVSRMIGKIKNEEDYITFQGSAKEKVLGLISTATTDLGDPGGNWKTDAGGDGILEIAQTDVEKAIDGFVSDGLGAYPIDIVMTSWIYNKFKNTVVPYDPKTNNLTILQGKLNGGEVMVSNNIQAGVLKSANTFVAIARTSEAEAAWQLLSSGLEQTTEKEGLWKTALGIREKFSVKVLDKKFIRWMDGITVA